MSGRTRLISKLRNPIVKAFLEANPPTSRLNWKSVTSLPSFGKAKLSQALAAKSQKEQARLLFPYVLRRNAFLNNPNSPKWMKRYVDALAPAPTALPVPNNVTEEAEQVFEPYLQGIKENLYPSDWATAYLNNKKGDTTQLKFWQKVLSDASAADAEYDKYLQSIYERLSFVFDEEHLAKLDSVIKNARQTSRQNFENIMKEHHQDVQKRKQTLNSYIEQHKTYANNLTGEEKETSEKDFKKWADSVKQRFERDTFVDSYLESHKSKTLERHVNLRLMDELAVDEGTRKAYRERDQQIEALRTRALEACENWSAALIGRSEQVSKWAKKFSASLDEQNIHLEEWVARLPDLTVNEVLDDHPDWREKIEFLMARHRWDPNMTDEDYKNALAKDLTWWNLPRNP